ncbi:MAG: asparaginase [Rubrivivax sp.]|nr:asparaginase [Rubrivivax sp.]
MASNPSDAVRPIVPCTLILGTGGTIAGNAGSAHDNVGYRSAERTAQELVAAVPGLQGLPLEAVQLFQTDSKDITHAHWWQLREALRHALARPDVGGVVVTHGTDTLEETAYWLHRTLHADKPVVLTAAMRPATSLQADGPQNLLDAVTLARQAGACGVLAVLAGRVHAGHELRKVRAYRVDAFSSADEGPLALLEEGQVRQLRAWPAPADALAVLDDMAEPAQWPWVEVVHSHGGASGRAVEALLSAGVDGLVVAATGNGTVHQSLLAALRLAEQRGVPVLRATRCVLGGLVDDGAWPPAVRALTPAQARVELVCRLLGSAGPAQWR